MSRLSDRLKGLGDIDPTSLGVGSPPDQLSPDRHTIDAVKYALAVNNRANASTSQAGMQAPPAEVAVIHPYWCYERDRPRWVVLRGPRTRVALGSRDKLAGPFESYEAACVARRMMDAVGAE